MVSRWIIFPKERRQWSYNYSSSFLNTSYQGYLSMWQKLVTFSSLCYVKFTHNSFVEYFVHILSKVSEAKKKSKRSKKTGYKKIIRPHAFDHSVQLCACGQRRLTEEELGTSQPFPCTTTPRWPSAVHHRRRTPTPRRRHRLCCMSRRERRAARCPKLRSQSAPSLLRTEPSWVS